MPGCPSEDNSWQREGFFVTFVCSRCVPVKTSGSFSCVQTVCESEERKYEPLLTMSSSPPVSPQLTWLSAPSCGRLDYKIRKIRIRNSDTNWGRFENLYELKTCWIPKDEGGAEHVMQSCHQIRTSVPGQLISGGGGVAYGQPGMIHTEM